MEMQMGSLILITAPRAVNQETFLPCVSMGGGEIYDQLLQGWKLVGRVCPTERGGQSEQN